MTHHTTMRPCRTMGGFIAAVLSATMLPTERGSAAVVTFETLPVGEALGMGSTLAHDGFNFVATSNTNKARFSGVTGSPVSNGLRFSWNGTNTLGLSYSGSENVGAAYAFSRSDARRFSLNSFDYAEFFKQGDFAFAANANSIVVEGVRTTTVVASITLTLDMLTDGVGGITDFQSAVLPPSFSNLDLVRIRTFSGTDTAVAIIDNINFTIVPEPGTGLLALLSSAALLRRKR